MAKRLFDIVVSVIGLGLLAIPFLLIAIAIKITTPGPVFFSQRRVGRNGRTFWLYKFRTMRESSAGPQVTAQRDDRVTPIGKILRRSKIDESPQLYNILLGQMSVVGPRPEVEEYVQHYDDEQRQILNQTPGLAGMAQLVFPDEAKMLAECSTPEEMEAAYIEQLIPRKVAVDLEYERKRTFFSDMRLIVEILLCIFGISFRVDRDFRVAPPKQSSSSLWHKPQPPQQVNLV